jgi:hypothetical protein
MPDDPVVSIAEATAEYGMLQLANWLPPEQHANVRELLYDLTVGALHAFADGETRRVPEPSAN